MRIIGDNGSDGGDGSDVDGDDGYTVIYWQARLDQDRLTTADYEFILPAIVDYYTTLLGYTTCSTY